VRINRRIRAHEVTLIDADGSQLGVMDTREALAKAQEQDLDLVEVDGRARPPVCKILDYGKHKYAMAKKARESKKTRFVQETKEIKMTPKIGEHDIAFKIKHAREFLEAGHKVRLLVRFRGREIVHPETGRAVLGRICEELGEVCVPLGDPQMEQRQMSLVIGPSPKAKARARSAAALKEKENDGA
jgi:translation initiation factor IF-3